MGVSDRSPARQRVGLSLNDIRLTCDADMREMDAGFVGLVLKTIGSMGGGNRISNLLPD